MTNQLTPKVYSLTANESAGMTITADSRFESVALLNAGQSILEPATPGDKAFSVWLKRQSVNADVTFMLTNGWAVNAEGVVVLDGTATSAVIPADQWFHLTLARTEQRLTLYLNGEYTGHIDGSYDLTGGDIGFSSTSGGICLHQQTVFDYRLDDSAIQSNFFSGLPTVKQRFIEVHPIDVSIENDTSGQFANYPGDKLFIVDAAAKDVIAQKLVISNLSDKAIHCPAINQTVASREHHHFELKFRNGVFTEITDKLKFTVDAGWIVSEPQQDSEDNGWSVFFLASSEKIIEPGDVIDIPFSYRSADGALGERGTHINLNYRGLLLNGEQTLAGVRNKQVDILNLSNNNVYIREMNDKISATDTIVDAMEKATTDDLDKLQDAIAASEDGDVDDKKIVDVLIDVHDRLIELDSEVDNTRTVTNKRIDDLEAGAPLTVSVYAPKGMVCGRSNTFTVYLKNRSNQDLSFGDNGEVVIKLPFGSGVSNLAETAAKSGQCSSGTFSDTDKYRVFTINTELWSVTSGEEKSFTFSNVTANDTMGNCAVSVEVRGLSGYQTQHLAVLLTKTTQDIAPLVGGDNVGIGTGGNEPEQKLHVEGKSYFTDNVGIGVNDPKQKLHVEGKSYFTDNVGIGINAPTEKLQVEGKIQLSNGGDLNCLFTDDDGNLRMTKNGGSELTMLINDENGNVGINEAQPGQKLDVAGNVQANVYYDKDDPGYYMEPAATSKFKKVTASEVHASNLYSTTLISNGHDGLGLRENGNYVLWAIGGRVRTGITGQYVYGQLMGRVNSNGSRLLGDRFSSSRTGKGEYKITLYNSSSYAPVCVGTCTDAGDDNTINISPTSNTELRVTIHDQDGNKEDCGFSFVCYLL